MPDKPDVIGSSPIALVRVVAQQGRAPRKKLSCICRDNSMVECETDNFVMKVQFFLLAPFLNFDFYKKI